MNMLELVVMERNRLVRYSILTSVIALVLAIWARDPLLNITTPFSGDEVGNITVGHAVLIGHPIVCVLFFVLVAQIFRYRNLVGSLPMREREHLDWKYGNFENERDLMKVTHAVCDVFRWFGMVGIPVVASGFLLFSQMDFSNQLSKERFSYRNMFNMELFFGVTPSYRTLHSFGKCDDDELERIEKDVCIERNTARRAILQRMPTLYQPFNFLGGAILEIIVVLGLFCTTIVYFRRREPGRG